jgi:hypothetical protein
LLSFVFICFSESGLFNGLRPIQIKKFFPLSPVVRRGLKVRLAPLFSPRWKPVVERVRSGDYQ